MLTIHLSNGQSIRVRSIEVRDQSVNYVLSDPHKRAESVAASEVESISLDAQ